MKTEIDRICGIMYTLLEHQPVIGVQYETINDIAVALVKEGYGNIKQAQIDILNELKTHSYYDDDYMEGYVFVNDIDELIEEVENETKKETSRSTL